VIPIIYFHAGSIKDPTSAPRHLQVSIQQCKKFNEHVILLGDDSNSQLDVDHYNIDEHSEGVDEFRSLYKHMSTNPIGFELTCIERWIVLANFVKKMGFDKVVYLDSDIMTFCNYEERENIFDKDYVGMVCAPQRFGPSIDSKKDWGVTGCISYWRHDVIVRFKDFIIRSYSDKIGGLLDKWNWHIESKYFGGICDMTIMYLFYFENNLQSLCKVQKDNSTFDQNFYVPENYLKNEYGFFIDEKPTPESNRGKAISWKEEDLVDLDGNIHHTPYYHNLFLDDTGDTLVRVNAMPELARLF
jgi:hypothetical protein